MFDQQAQELEADGQQYDPTPIVNDLRRILDAWRESRAYPWLLWTVDGARTERYRHNTKSGTVLPSREDDPTYRLRA